MPRIYEGSEQRGVRPIITLKATPGVKAGTTYPVVRSRNMGLHRRRSQARPCSVPLPLRRVLASKRSDQSSTRCTRSSRASAPWKKLYHRRLSVERRSGLEHERGLLPLRVRGVEW